MEESLQGLEEINHQVLWVLVELGSVRLGCKVCQGNGRQELLSRGFEWVVQEEYIPWYDIFMVQGMLDWMEQGVLYNFFLCLRSWIHDKLCLRCLWVGIGCYLVVPQSYRYRFQVFRVQNREYQYYQGQKFRFLLHCLECLWEIFWLLFFLQW